jgi:hypothetical protein
MAVRLASGCAVAAAPCTPHTVERPPRWPRRSGRPCARRAGRGWGCRLARSQTPARRMRRPQGREARKVRRRIKGSGSDWACRFSRIGLDGDCRVDLRGHSPTPFALGVDGSGETCGHSRRSPSRSPSSPCPQPVSAARAGCPSLEIAVVASGGPARQVPLVDDGGSVGVDPTPLVAAGRRHRRQGQFGRRPGWAQRADPPGGGGSRAGLFHRARGPAPGLHRRRRAQKVVRILDPIGADGFWISPVSRAPRGGSHPA